MAGVNLRETTKSWAHSVAATVTVVFLIAGTTWILLTDVLVYRLVADRALIARLETAKGWLFVGLTAALVFGVTSVSVARLARAEATIRAVVNSVADGVLILARDGTIADANPAAARMLGVQTPDELKGMGAEQFSRRFHVSYPDGRLVQPEQFISQRALQGEELPPYKLRLYPPGRPELVIVSTAAPVRLVAGGPVELAVSVIHDVTEVDGLERLREQFFSAAAHALKTPVSIIKARVHLWGSRGPSPLDPSAVAVIERQCGKISRLTENMLLLSRLRSGALRLHPEIVDCADIVEAVTREMRSASAAHGLVFKLEGRPAVFVDRESIAQVLRNLIEMAYRRAHAQTEVIVVLDESAARARLRVVYQSLSAEDALGEEDGAGFTGLGLERHLVESLVKAAGGTFRSEQDVPPFCTDWVEIPTVASGGPGQA